MSEEVEFEIEQESPEKSEINAASVNENKEESSDFVIENADCRQSADTNS